MPESRRPAALAGACAAATAFVFLPAARYPFLDWDDGVNVVRNPNLNFSAAGVAWMAAGSRLGHWHPLTWLTLALDRAVWGGDPFGFHLTNVAFHALNAALFFFLARRLLRSPGARDAHADAAALFAALFWALHPLRVEPVAWVTERRDVLSAALMLASALSYVRGADAGDGAKASSWRRAALALGSAAMAAKVFAVVLPGVFLILDARLRARPRWREKLPWLAPAALALGFNLAAQASSGAEVSWAAFGLKARLLQAVYGISFYAEKTLWPTGLGPLYERSPLLEPVPFLVSGLAAAAAAAALWVWRRRFPWLVQTFLAYALLALPALGLFKSGRMTAADRYAYLPGLPLALLAGAALARAPFARAARAAGVSVLLACAWLAAAQLPVWSSDVALWTRACEVSPLSYFARLKLASAEDAAGLPARAESDRAEAARLHAEVFGRAAAIYAARGDATAASAARERAERGLQFEVP